MTAAAALLTLAGAGPASAELIEGQGSCSGSATIDGVTYTESTPTKQSPIRVSKAPGQRIPWQGSTTFDNNNHRGALNLMVGPVPIAIANWSDPDPDAPNSQSNQGTLDLDSEFYEHEVNPLGRNIVGIYEIRGSHGADGGRCAGFAFVEFEGSVFDSPIGTAAAAGTAAGLAGMAGATVAKKPRGGPGSGGTPGSETPGTDTTTRKKGPAKKTAAKKPTRGGR